MIKNMIFSKLNLQTVYHNLLQKIMILDFTSYQLRADKWTCEEYANKIRSNKEVDNFRHLFADDN